MGLPFSKKIKNKKHIDDEQMNEKSSSSIFSQYKKSYFCGSIISSIIFLLIIFYWMSLAIDYTHSKEFGISVRTVGYSYEPFSVNLEYDLLNNININGLTEGTEIEVSPNGMICQNKEDVCLTLVIKSDDEGNLFADFSDKNILPKTIAVKDFFNYCDIGKANKSKNEFYLHGKIAKNNFIISKITNTNS